MLPFLQIRLDKFYDVIRQSFPKYDEQWQRNVDDVCVSVKVERRVIRGPSRIKQCGLVGSHIPHTNQFHAINSQVCAANGRQAGALIITYLHGTYLSFPYPQKRKKEWKPMTSLKSIVLIFIQKNFLSFHR